MKRKEIKPAGNMSIVGQLVLAVLKGKIKILNLESTSKSYGWKLLKKYDGKAVSLWLKNKGAKLSDLEYQLYFGYLTIDIDAVSAPRVQYARRTLGKYLK